MHQVGYLQELNRDVRSTKHKIHYYYVQILISLKPRYVLEDNLHNILEKYPVQGLISYLSCFRKELSDSIS